jgi:hypothetical protein
MKHGGPIKILVVGNPGARGFGIVLLWVLQATLIINQRGGVHLTIQLSLGPIAVSVGIGIWDTVLPR